MNKCKYDIPWYGKCNKPVISNSEYCENHDEKCIICGNTATHGCTIASSLVCGAPLCDNEKCIKSHNNKHYN